MGKDALASEPPGLKFNMFLKTNSEHSDFFFFARGKKKEVRIYEKEVTMDADKYREIMEKQVRRKMPWAKELHCQQMARRLTLARTSWTNATPLERAQANVAMAA